MVFKLPFNSVLSRHYAHTSFTTAPLRRTIIFIAFSSLCALGIFVFLYLGALDLDFDFSVPVLDSKDTGRVLHTDVDFCNFDYSTIDDVWNRKNKDPYISFIVNNELVIADKEIALESIFTGKHICILVLIPDSIINNSKMNRFSNKNIYVRALSENAIRIISVFSISNYKNFYQGIGLFNYPGNYSLNLTIELPGLKDITIASDSTLRLSLNDESLRKEPNYVLPICNATSEIVGQWLSVFFYDSLHPLSRYSNFLDIDDEYIFVPDQCRMELITPIEQLLCLKNQTIHAYGDEILWGSLLGIEGGYERTWCDNRCSCKFPEFPILSTLGNLSFANTSSFMFGSTSFFHPIKNLLEESQEISWKVALEQGSNNEQVSKADIVIISVSNSIFMNSSISLQDFETKLTELLSNISDNYPNSTIFVRTPEPFTLSQHIPNVSRVRYLQVRDVTLNVAKEIGMYLWDVGILDGKDWDIPSYCVARGFKMSKTKLWLRDVIVKLESQFLFHSYCLN